MKSSSGSRGAPALRTALALAMLLFFWGAPIRDLRYDAASFLLRMAQSVRGAGAQEVQSEHLDVGNRSGAGQEEVRRAVEALEADYVAIHRFLGRAPDYRVPVLIVDGAGPALTDGSRLSLFYDGGGLDLRTAPFSASCSARGRCPCRAWTPLQRPGSPST